jgi:N-methylhydantoinase A
VGFLTAPLAFDFVRTFFGQLDRIDWDQVNALFDDMAGQGVAILARSGVPAAERRVSRQADLRYSGQGHEIRVDLPEGALDATSLPAITARFERVYESLFGRTGPDVPLEAVSWRLLASGPRPSVQLRTAAQATSHDPLKRHRAAFFPEWGNHHPTPVYDRYLLQPGMRLDGPAIIEERESTTVVGPQASAEVDEFRNLHITP